MPSNVTVLSPASHNTTISSLYAGTQVLRERTLEDTAEYLQVRAVSAAAADSDHEEPPPMMRAQLSIGYDEVISQSSSNVDDGASVGGQSTFEDMDASLASGKSNLDSAIASLSDTLVVPPGQSLLLLAHYSWDRGAVVEAFVEDEKATRRSAGLPQPGCDQFAKARPLIEGKAQGEGGGGIEAKKTQNELVCLVCFDDLDASSTSPLTCGHVFCSDCWSRHLAVQLTMQPRGGVACMGVDCTLRVTEESLAQIGVGQSLLDQWRNALAKSFLEATGQSLKPFASSTSSNVGEKGSSGGGGNNSGAATTTVITSSSSSGKNSARGPRLVRCKSLTCSAVIRVPSWSSSGAQVTCGECSFSFCALCDFPAPHAPATCTQVATWQAKGGKVEASDEDMANWLAIKKVRDKTLLQNC